MEHKQQCTRVEPYGSDLIRRVQTTQAVDTDGTSRLEPMHLSLMGHHFLATISTIERDGQLGLGPGVFHNQGIGNQPLTPTASSESHLGLLTSPSISSSALTAEDPPKC